MLRALLLSLVVVLSSAAIQADPVIVTLPIESVVFVSLTTNPVVTIGTRTIDFTPSLSQQFIHFAPVTTLVAQGWRITIGLRARDGLASLSGMLPPSPDPGFVNVLPMFPFGTTDLLLFDVIIQGGGTRFPFTLTDLDGDTATPMFSTPVPEPGTLVLMGLGVVVFVLALRRRPWLASTS